MTNGIHTTAVIIPGTLVQATLSISGDLRFCQIPEKILFDTASSFLDSSLHDNILAFQKVLSRIQLAPPGEQLLVVGHTDDVGSSADNDKLSQRRAEAVLAVLRGSASTWETNYKMERNKAWGDDNFRTMLREVTGTSPTNAEINRHKELTSAGEARRATLFAGYFNILLSRPTSLPSFSTLSPATLACGKRHTLGAGVHAPSRRAEFFFFRGTTSPLINCDEYPRWLTPCGILPPASITVTISAVDTIQVGQVESIQVTVNPSPLPLGATVTLELSTTSGTGEAEFVSTGSKTLEISGTSAVRVRGITASSQIDNVRLTARITGQPAVLDQEDLMVVSAVSIFLKFEVWSLTSRAFEPLPAGVDVDVMDFDPVSNDRLHTRQTDALGRVFFLVDRLDPDEPEPDIFFLVHTAERSHAGHTLPDEWSTKGWKATDGTAGFHPRFSGVRLGTPSSPLVFRVGLDFHARLEYQVDGGSRSGSIDPAPPHIPVNLMQEERGFDTQLLTLRTDENGEVHAVSFDAEPGRNFYIHVTFEMEDSAINLKKTTVKPLLTDILDFGTLEWDSNEGDGDDKVFSNHSDTSIGAQASPEKFTCKLSRRNVALYQLKVLRELGVFLFEITDHRWKGVELRVFPHSPSGTAFSWPRGQLNIPESSQWERDTIIHEMSHQVMWKEADVGSLALGVGLILTIAGITTAVHGCHDTNMLASNEHHALVEGWAEFVEAIFEGTATPPYSFTDVFQFSDNTSCTGRTTIGPLGPGPGVPNNRGQRVEGAFANGLWAIFKQHVVGAASTSVRVPERATEQVLTDAPWIRNSGVRERFISMIWRPLGDLSEESSETDKTTGKVLERMRAHNASAWHRLQPELQAFNMAIDALTIADVTTLQDNISPAWGSVNGGQTIRITGTDFVERTTVVNSAGSSIVETTVEVGGRPAANITLISSTLLNADVPAGTVGPKDVVVTARISGLTNATFGTATKAGGFIYIDDPLTVIAVSPIQVPTCRQQSVTIFGTGFLPVPNTAVFVDVQQVPSDSVHVLSASEIQISTPIRAAIGVAVVTVQVPGEVDNSNTVEYMAAPCVFDVTPRQGNVSGGEAVTIVGQNFPPNVVVEMESQTLVVTFIDPGTIEIVTPSRGLPGLTGIRIFNPALPQHLSDEMEFIYTI